MRRDDGTVRSRSASYLWVVGPDGCGKSTLASEVSARRGAVHRYWRPGVLPMPRELVGRPVTQGINADPHSASQNNRLRRTLRVCYYALDYALGYWLLISPALRRGQDVIFERGWADMTVDPLRYGLGRSRLAARLQRVIQEPDAIVVVCVAASEARRRKPELTEDEIERQYALWRAIPFRRAQLLELDNGRPLSESSQELVDWMAARAPSAVR